MSDYGILDSGFKTKQLQTILDDLRQKITVIFGSGINLSDQSPDGQIAAVFAAASSDLWELAQDAYDAANPKAARGVALSNLVQLNGITRLPAAPSSVILTFTRSGATGTPITIPAGTQVSTTDGGIVFALAFDATILSANTTVDAQVFCTINGPTETAAATLQTLVSAVAGVASVTNALAATPGSFAESDADLRRRRALSTATPSQSMLESLLSGIGNVANVTKLVVLENTGDTVDANGTAAHGIQVVVYGGADSEIADQIFKRKAVGIATSGSTTATVVDSQGLAYTMRFTRPTLVDIKVNILTTALPGAPADLADRIKKSFLDYAAGLIDPSREYNLGDDVIYSRLFSAPNSVPLHDITSMLIFRDANPPSASNIVLSISELANFTTANISVTVS